MAYHKLLEEAAGMQRSAAQKKAHTMAQKAIAIVNAMYEDSQGDADLDIRAMEAIERRKNFEKEILLQHTHSSDWPIAIPEGERASE